MVKNCALVFLKPHAVTDKAKECVKKKMQEHDIAILKEGSIAAEDIDKKKLIDQHYYAIASKATLLKPTQLKVPKDKFKEFFGIEWDQANKEGKVFNAADACEKLGVDAEALVKLWREAEGRKNMIKFGGGFYCGKLEPAGEDPIYVFNGFFMSMRSAFVKPGAEVYYFVVDFDQTKLSWEDFRGKVCGPTNPANAEKNSLRGQFYSQWNELDLKFQPNVGDNAIHASASPFEGLAERMNWLGYRPDRDAFGKKLLTVVTKGQIKEWSVDPQVTFGPSPITKSLFDSVEDMDSDKCLAFLHMISAGSAKSKAEKQQRQVLQAENAKLIAEVQKFRDVMVALKTVTQFKGSNLLPPKVDEDKGKKGKGKGQTTAGNTREANAKQSPGRGGGAKQAERGGSAKQSSGRGGDKAKQQASGDNNKGTKKSDNTDERKKGQGKGARKR
eukprot:GEMP01021265.1.p1 GENE.GEMP01021265.1~~GEMP01021265.1.p1  ORF type:complete len:443 (+),score=126.96 GEMP01021265.1:108-1436(+)